MSRRGRARKARVIYRWIERTCGTNIRSLFLASAVESDEEIRGYVDSVLVLVPDGREAKFAWAAGGVQH